jgi:hypothetical protein
MPVQSHGRLAADADKVTVAAQAEITFMNEGMGFKLTNLNAVVLSLKYGRRGPARVPDLKILVFSLMDVNRPIAATNAGEYDL